MNTGLINGLIRGRLPALAFSSQEDEQLFSQESYTVWLRQSIIGGILALAFNNTFLLMDYMISPAVFEVGLQVRLYWCTSLGLIAPILGALTFRGVLSPTRVLQESFVVASAAMAGLSILLVSALSPIHGTAWGIFYHVGLVPTMVFGTVMARLRFRAACALVASLLLMHWIALALTPHVPDAPVFSVMLSVAAPAVFMLMFSYQFEAAERRRFAQKQRAKALRAQLQVKRADLERASFRDPLTDVGNRRGFAMYMDELVSRASSGPMPYAILLMDVDHFKLYNDRYGHPAGDEVLQRIAQALRQQLQRASDRVYRVGGEEFAILLDINEPPDKVLSFIDHMRLAVHALAIPHEGSPHGTVSISMGLLMLKGLSVTRTSAELYSTADAMLYQAKQAGRNSLISQTLD